MFGKVENRGKNKNSTVLSARTFLSFGISQCFADDLRGFASQITDFADKPFSSYDEKNRLPVLVYLLYRTAV